MRKSRKVALWLFCGPLLGLLACLFTSAFALFYIDLNGPNTVATVIDTLASFFALLFVIAAMGGMPASIIIFFCWRDQKTV